MCERLPGLAYMLKQAWVVCVRHTLPQKKQTLNAEKAALERTLLTKGSELQGISQSFLESSRLLLEYHRKLRPKAMAEGLADDHSVLNQSSLGPLDFTQVNPAEWARQHVLGADRTNWDLAWSGASFCPRNTACQKQSLVAHYFMVRK